MSEIEKIIEKGNELDKIIPSAYQLLLSDVQALFDMPKYIIDRDGFLNAIIVAFKLGFVRGNHYTVNRKAKKI